MTASISVIIPALNEAARLGRTLEAVAAGGPHEVIVVDGGSDDGTATAAAAGGARVVEAERGRGSQMNAGAARASGDVFLFVHADTLLPRDWADHVRGTLGSPGVAAGAFTLRIDGAARGLRRVERAVAWRSRVRQRPYGDQALFVFADMFRVVGGYPDWPLLEDVELAARLRRRGRIAIAPAAVLTSDRRWRTCGVWCATLINQMCLVAHTMGVSPHRIALFRSLRSGLRPHTRSRTARRIRSAGLSGSARASVP